MGLYRDEAIVLRTQKLGEADRIITLLTRESGRVRAVVAQSWARSGDAGVSPVDHLAPILMDEREIEARWSQHPLYAVLPLLRDLLRGATSESGHMLVISDAEGVLLWMEGHHRVIEATHDMHFVCGADWSERGAGTRQAPCPQASHISSQEASKPTERPASTRSPGPRGASWRNMRDSASTNAAAERWLIATPFGVPVDPEVKMIQASSEGCGPTAVSRGAPSPPLDA